MASERHRRNSIASLTLGDGSVTSNHDVIADAFHKAFKERMGQAKGINMGLDLENLIQKVPGLNVLVKPFGKEEIEQVVKEMSVDKSPGPDGFNGLFFKKCWHLISNEFNTLVQDFHVERVHLENINGSFIVLVPKSNAPEGVGDYRPISLTSFGLKLLTKMAANRFQWEIMRCIHKNQYGFIQSRTIQDCLAWSFEYIHQCK